MWRLLGSPRRRADAVPGLWRRFALRGRLTRFFGRRLDRGLAAASSSSGTSSPCVRVSGNWRIVFCFADGEAVDVDLIDYH